MMRVRWCVVLLGGLALAGGCSDDDAGVADASVSDDASPADGGDAGDAGSECPAGFQDNDGDGECAPDCGAAGLTCGAMAVCTDGSGVAECVCDAGTQDNDGDGNCSADCASTTCGANATCADDDGDATCSCDAGFQDNDADGDCSADCATAGLSCMANAECSDDDGTATCVCAFGFQDEDGDGTCEPGCGTDTCSGNGTCSADTGTVVCDCDDGFAGVDCSSCAAGLQDLDGDGVCTPACQAEGDRCLAADPGTFDQSAADAECASACEPFGLVWNGNWTTEDANVTAAGCAVGSDVVCGCVFPTATPGDRCLVGAPGTFDMAAAEAQCPGVCALDALVWDGSFDATSAGVGAAGCNAGSEVVCGCAAPAGVCLGESQVCDDATGTASCACAAGTQDNDGDGDCSTDCVNTTCGLNTSCDDATGTATCGCNAGFQDNDADGDCTANCDSVVCGTNASCSDATGTATCGCNAGFQDNDADGDCAADCASTPCGANASCSDATGTATCACDAGFQDNDADGDCAADCASTPCGANASCSDATGTATCACDAGFQDNDADGDCAADCASTTCGLRGCDDSSGTAVCVQSGCADGTREGFVDDAAYPTIAGCSGGWDQPGVLAVAPPACGRNAGNDSTNPTGTGCNVEDLCAPGWAVCGSTGDVLTASGGAGCGDATVAGDPDLFFAARVSGPGSAICGASGANDLFGCGNMGGNANGSCSPLTRYSNDLCGQLPTGGWSCGAIGVEEANNVTKTQATGGGVMCCSLLPTAGLTAHYDAQSAGSFTFSSGTSVSEWRDLSGNGRHLAVRSGTPELSATINGHPAVDFAGETGMFTPAFPLTRDVTVFAVVTHRNPEAWGAVAHHGNRDQDWSMEQSGLDAPSPILHWQSANDNTGAELTLASGTSYVLAGRIGGTNRDFMSVELGGATATATATGNNISVGNKSLYVGSSDVGESYRGLVGEFIYYDRALSDAERAAVIAYLESRWL